ncbi:unnamed protein product [Closterium sp. NIES-65]|nr:unnamed protein product [Closterium sp. NIES-65]
MSRRNVFQEEGAREEVGGRGEERGRGEEGGVGKEGRVFVGERLLAAVGAVFTLYCLFHTQRTAPYPPTLIYLPLDSVRLLLLFVQEAPHHKAWDAVASLQALFFGPLSSPPSAPPPASSSSSPHTPAPPSSAFVVGAVPLPQQLQAGLQQRAGQARRLVEQQLRVMKQKLFAHLPIERHIQSDAAEVLDVEQADAACWLYDNSLQRLKTCKNCLFYPTSASLPLTIVRTTCFITPVTSLSAIRTPLNSSHFCSSCILPVKALHLLLFPFIPLIPLLPPLPPLPLFPLLPILPFLPFLPLLPFFPLLSLLSLLPLSLLPFLPLPLLLLILPSIPIARTPTLAILNLSP